MIKRFAIGLCTVTTLSLWAQTNPAPVRLAIVSETPEAAMAADLLTVELSKGGGIQLLERNEIEKAWREQGMSAANRDDLKLGRVLGADGLLLLDVLRTPQSTNLIGRLVAVKPGVVVANGGFLWPLTDASQWAGSAAAYYGTFCPKLTLLPRDAIPISVVNLRSAVQSAEGRETERQLKLLTIQRLSQERQFFVLERQKMQSLGEEKELKSDESPFWDGSWLLEGIVDQSGYSKDTITINGSLTPRKGGSPLVFEVAGSRTNLAEVVNALAVKVAGLLNINSTVKDWNAADEATHYLDEAKWALRWGVYPEAEASADSAWALGKRDLECASVRVKSYMLAVSTVAQLCNSGQSTLDPHGGFDKSDNPLGPPPGAAEVQREIHQLQTRHPLGLACRTCPANGAVVIDYIYADTAPDPQNIDTAFHALELYKEFSLNSSADLLKVASEESSWRNSDWYDLGVQDLVAASTVLQDFHFAAGSRAAVADKLEELRALARSVADWICRTPAVHDSYFVGDRLAPYDELAFTIGEDGGRNPNIFSCEATWGCFWQERPEDDIALYRQLMSSPVFCYIHTRLWLRDLQRPRLVAWNDNDEQRLPLIWNNFIGELNVSTNLLLRMEANAFALADATNDGEMAVCFTNFFDTIFANRDALVASKVELLYLNWGAGRLVEAGTGTGIATKTGDSLSQLFFADYRPRIEAMDQEYRHKTIPAAQTSSSFEKQKQFLAGSTSYDFMKFNDLFQDKNYTTSQAAELRPLISAYESNLLSQALGPLKFKARADAQWIEAYLGNTVDTILNPASSQSPVAPPIRPPGQPQAPARAITATAAAPPASHGAPDIVSNILTVNGFLRIPTATLTNDGISDVTITSHHFTGGKLLLDLQYSAVLYLFDNRGAWKETRNLSLPAVAILNLASKHWDVIGCPEVDFVSQNNLYHRSALLNGDLFNCDGGQIRKYDFGTRQWQVSPVSDGNNYELFAVNDHLYAASRNIIFEILDSGKSSRILASARRNPPVSALDGQDLGTPILLAGPDHSLRVSLESRIYTWAGSDWREDSAVPPASFPPEIFPDGALYRKAAGTPGQSMSISVLPTEADVPTLCLSQKLPASQVSYSFQPGASPARTSAAQWKMPADLFFFHLPAATRPSGMYLLANHSRLNEIANDQNTVVKEEVVAEDRCNAELLCFSSGLPRPRRLFLNFDAPDGCPPAAGIDPDSRGGFPVQPPAWMLFASNTLVLGLEKPRNSIPAFNQADRIGIGYQAGIWLVPDSEIESAIAAHGPTQLTSPPPHADGAASPEAASQ
jgi:hypothetical protein